MKKHFYIIGVLLIIIACTDLTITWMLMYGAYLLGLGGVVLIFLSNKKLWIKILTVILLPPITYYIVVFSFFYIIWPIWNYLETIAK